MRTIAYRNNAIGVMYCIVALVGIIELVSCIANLLPMSSSVIGVLLMAISLWVLVGFFRTSNEAIRFDEANDTLVISKKVSIPLGEISGASCKQARSRYGSKLSWGSIIISTYTGATYTLRCVADCEYALERVNQLRADMRKKSDIKST